MSISKEINIDVLNEIYSLSAFHGLRAAHPDDQWNDQMTEETEGNLPNTDENSNDHANAHVKQNPTLEAMRRASVVHSSNEIEKIAKQTKTNNGQLDHNSLTASDHLATPLNRSVDDLTKITELEFCCFVFCSSVYFFCLNREENADNDAILEIADTSGHRAKMTKSQVERINFIMLKYKLWFDLGILASC